MPELKSPDGSSPLSQKRVTLSSNSIPKIESLDRVEREMPPQLTHVRQPMKVDLNQKANLINPEEKNSSAKIVIWVVIVIVLAIASYLGLKSFLNGPTTTDNSKTTNYVTPVVDFISKIVLPGKSLDSQADSRQSFAMYNNGSQSVGAASSGIFDLTDIFVQKYTSFTRLGIQVGNIAGDGSMPLVNVTYDKTLNEITVELLNTSTTLDMPYSTEVVIGTNTVDSLTRLSTDNSGSEKFLVKLSQPTVYLLQASSSSDSPTIYLDIKEVSAVTPSVAPTGLVTVTPSMTPTITSTGGDILENVYSKNAQVLHNGISNNTASINRFYYHDGATEFTYKAEIIPGTGDKMPNVSAKLEGTILTVEVTNLLSRSASATLSLSGTKDLQKVDVLSSGNTRTYTFTLNSSKDYKISYKFDDPDYPQYANALWIQVKH